MRVKNSRGVAALFAVLLVIAALGCAKRPEAGETTVLANQAWTDSGLDIAANHVITVKASGQIYANPTDATGPEGLTGHPERNDLCVVPKAPYAALIGKVGQRGLPFAVGLERSILVTRAGRLFLGVNDQNPSDNKGTFKATVTVK